MEQDQNNTKIKRSQSRKDPVSQILEKTVFCSKVDCVDSNPKKVYVFDPHFTHFELMSTKVAVEEDEGSECLRCLWPFLCFARILGMCPISKQRNRLYIKSPNIFLLLTSACLILQTIMITNSVIPILNLTKHSDTYTFVGLINDCIYYAHTIGNCLFMGWRIKELPGFLKACKRIENICKKYDRSNDGLVTSCYLLFSFFITTQVLGNTLYYYARADRVNATSIKEFFYAFNTESRAGISKGSQTGAFLAVGELYCDLGWNFADVLLTFLSLILTRYFIRLNKGIAARHPETADEVECLRFDHQEICNLVKHCNQIFAPLFLLTYVANVGYLFTRLYLGLSSDIKIPLISVQFESIYSVGYQVLVKMLIPTYFAANLNEKAHEALDLINSWSSNLKCPENKFRLLLVNRFASQLVTSQIGISGCGYFLITKSFLITLISALITYEIVILQFQAASLSNSPRDCP